MIRPFKPNNLFLVNNSSEVKFDDGVIIIDDFFSSYEIILEYIHNVNVEIWKSSPNTRNFIDYYDCRHSIHNSLNDYCDFDLKIMGVLKKFCNLDVLPNESEGIQLNYFKHLNRGVSSNLQHYPHIDFDINMIVYLDEASNGGTALYSNVDSVGDYESVNLLYDVSNYDKRIISAKPNRCVLFSGKQFHGGHIDQHDVYYDSWRINLVRFYECILPGS